MSDAPAAAAPASAAAADAAGSSSSAAAAPAAAGGAAAAAPAATTGGTRKKGKGKKEEVLEVDPNFEGQKYRIGELIYANYAESVASHGLLLRAAQVSSAGLFHASDFADVAWLRMCMTSCARRGKQWFEAKVLKVEKRQGKIYYYLHYNGQPDTALLSTLTSSCFPCDCNLVPSL
jgi:hypothetical protein